jgi:hypothetical protein
MGHLDEAAFERTIQACAACGGTTFEIATYLDRVVSVMLADANDAGRWAHDGEKFIDGTYRVRCTGCGANAYASDDCPRCHREGALSAALAATSHVTVPKRCPTCSATEMTVVAFAPATAKTGPGIKPAPVMAAAFGEPGFHVIGMSCDDCDWAHVTQTCPICEGPGPLRPRP